MLNMTDREFRELQAKILGTDTADNEYMPASTRQTENKAINTIKKDVVGSINELLNSLDCSNHPGDGNVAVANIKVNGKSADPEGNIEINSILKAERDMQDRRIDKTYATKNEVKALRDEFLDVRNNSASIVKTINGMSPDIHGNFELKTVSRAVQADRAANDYQGHDIASTYATRNQVDKDLKALSNDVVHTVDGKSVHNGNLDLKGTISDALSEYAKTEDLKFYVTPKQVDEKLKLFDVVHKVNGMLPDRDGNITISSVQKAENAYSAQIAATAENARNDEQGNPISKTYVTQKDAAAAFASKRDILSIQDDLDKQKKLYGRANVKTINGREPDINGNIDINNVATADRAKMDEHGRKIEETYATKEFVTDKVVFVKRLVSGVDNAYDLAVRNDLFEGTLEEWLATLKGETGDRGPQGMKGDQGIQGEKGEPGDKVRIKVKETIINGVFAADKWNGNEYTFKNTYIKENQVIRMQAEADDTETMCGIDCKSQKDGCLIFEATAGIPEDGSKFKLILQDIESGEVINDTYKIVRRYSLSYNKWQGNDYIINDEQLPPNATMFINLPTGASKTSHQLFSKAMLGVSKQEMGGITLTAYGEVPAQDLEIQAIIIL